MRRQNHNKISRRVLDPAVQRFGIIEVFFPDVEKSRGMALRNIQGGISGSTDATLDIAKGHAATLLHIRKEDFDYSKALNRGIKDASGDFIVILSAHSIPCDSGWLAAMLAHFQDAAVAGVYSRQMAWPDAPWWEQRRVRREFPATTAVYE